MTHAASTRSFLSAALTLTITALALAQSDPAPTAPQGGAAGEPPAGQAPLAPDAATQPATQAADAIPLTARVIEVAGDVQHAPIGSRAWQPCRADDEYPPETKIRTGVRSSIKLQLGSEEPYTAVLIESVGLVSIAELARTPESKRVRLGVGYGKIRAGVAEGGLQSDFTVDSPVATLSKRGTWNFGLSYDRGTDRFEVFLADRGLVDALKKVTAERRTLQRGQAVTEAMRRWLDEVQFRENVPIVDLFGQEDLQVAFNQIDNSGLGVLGPGNGRANVIAFNNASARQQFSNDLQRALLAQQLRDRLTPDNGGGPLIRPEGFFGTGRGDQLIPLLIERNSALAKSGNARPGAYWIRRSAAESWLGRATK